MKFLWSPNDKWFLSSGVALILCCLLSMCYLYMHIILDQFINNRISNNVNNSVVIFQNRMTGDAEVGMGQLAGQNRAHGQQLFHVAEEAGTQMEINEPPPPYHEVMGFMVYQHMPRQWC